MILPNAEITIIKSNRKTVGVEIRPNKVTVRAPINLKESELEKLLEFKRTWIENCLVKAEQKREILNTLPRFTQEKINELAEEAKEIIPKRVEYFAEKIGVDYGRITIRCQRTRWGSCSTSGNLNFNCLLVLTPSEVLDSVVVHELCHRKQMNHSPKFYAEMERAFPNYKECDKWLKKHGSALLAALDAER